MRVNKITSERLGHLAELMRKSCEGVEPSPSMGDMIETHLFCIGMAIATYPGSAKAMDGFIDELAKSLKSDTHRLREYYRQHGRPELFKAERIQ